MGKKAILPIVVIFLQQILGTIGCALGASDRSDPCEPAIVNQAYPGLATGSLIFARLADLPEGVVLRAEDLVIMDKDVANQIATAPEQVRPQLGRNAFFVLEGMATRRLLYNLANKKFTGKKDMGTANEQQVIQDYIKDLIATVQVTDEDLTAFYNDNKDALAGVSFEQVKEQLRQVVLQERQQKVIDDHVRTLGQRIRIEVSSAWVRSQAALARDNPVDRARHSGKPSLVDFGSTGCVPCDMLAPILDRLREKYKGRLNVVFVHVGQEQVLAARYGISSIPTQIFYDKDGNEVFRHVGFWPQEQIEQRLGLMGVR